MAAGVKLLVVTLGPRGAVYFESATPIRTALLPAPAVEAIDPTGCGDVFGAALCARLVSGDQTELAIQEAQRLAARNATLRGATSLGRLLKGELVGAGA
jgi:sugar/nucleoside kinase (ribokinase family)